jgi:alkylhydroperoxidase/carboxymuconolactone decarboxylase family protein YurZ
MPESVSGCWLEAAVEPPEEILRKLAICDDALIRRVLADEEDCRAARSPLGAKAHALVRVASLIAVDATASSYLWATDAARSAGATDEELVGCLLAALPVLGAARVVSAAPKLGLALGYDVGAALEASDALLG